MNEPNRTEVVPEVKKCPQCGAALPAGLLAGLCPACLLQQGASADTATQSEASSFEVLSVAEVAKLFPHLEIIELLGKGGMGAVYKARQPALDRLVALKILPPQAAASPGFPNRFNREARALARLSHPNIVALYEFGQAERDDAGFVPIGGDGAALRPFFFIMEFVDGLNLRQLEQAGRLSAREALQIIPQICEALQFAHDEGIVHRDIKPENILIDKKGRVKIADFGIAKMMGGDEVEVTMTETKQAIGTPHYMAPEQVEKPQTVDHRADIYSLGVVFYEMLTGELPLGKFAPPSRKVQLDVRLDEVVLRALEKEPEQRYQHASQVKTDVETIAGSPGATAQPPISAASAQPRATSVVVGPPRFSRTAIVGACWAPLIFFVVVAWFTAVVHVAVPAGTQPPGPAWWQMLLTGTLLPLGLLSPAGTTLLGWIAVAQIRRSAGRLHGLWLAVFDGLLFPMLVLDGLMVCIWVLVARLVAHLVWNMHSSLFVNGTDAVVWIVLMVASAVLVDFLIIRAVWRAVNKPFGSTPSAPGSASGSAAPPLVGTPATPARARASVAMVVVTLVVHGVVLGVLLALAVFVVPRFIVVYQDMGVSLPPATALVITLERFLVNYWFLVFPAVLALDAGVCFLLRQIGGRRALLGWAVGVVGALGVAAVGLGLALFLPMQSLTQSLNPTKVPSGPPTPTLRSEFPEGAHISANNRSVFVSHDRVVAHYALYYEGDFNATSHGSHSTGSLKWAEDTTLRLKNQSTFGCLRDSVSPDSLLVNGRPFDLRLGRVLVLRDDGTTEQLPLFPPLAVARDVNALAKLIADQRSQPVTSRSFGPVMERVLPSGAPCMEQYFQFRQGKTFVVGRGPATTKEEHDQDWKKAEDAGGMDITAGSGPEGIQLVGHGCIFTSDVGELNWDIFTAEQLVSALKHVSFSYGVMEPRTKDLPITYLFKTAHGECGIMQIIGAVEDERGYHGQGAKGYGMKFRYKLVRESAAAPLAPVASAETWTPTLAPGQKLDLDAMRREVQELTASSHYEEALQRCLWYHRHALEYDSSLSAVRLSFALADWVELARRYPKARAALIEVRDFDARQFTEGRGSFDLFMDVSRINSALQQDEATVALFKTVLQQDPPLARQCYFAAAAVLFQRSEYELCLSGMGGSEAELARIRAVWEWETKKSVPSKTTQDNFVRDACRLINILVGLGRKTEAEGISTQTVAVFDDPRLRSAVSDAEKKVGEKR